MFSIFQPIALKVILSLPIVAWGGILLFILLLVIAFIGRQNMKGNFTIPTVWHPRLAALAIIIAILHALFGLSLFIK